MGIDLETGEVTPDTPLTTEEQKQELLNAWYNSLTAARAAKLTIENEQALRKQVIETFFPNPNEGANHILVGVGWKLSLTYKIDRKLDEAALTSVREKLIELYEINPDTLIEMKPSLKTTEYKALKALNAEAGTLFENALIIKPGSHTLEFTPPKEKAAK